MDALVEMTLGMEVSVEALDEKSAQMVVWLKDLLKEEAEKNFEGTDSSVDKKLVIASLEDQGVDCK